MVSLVGTCEVTLDANFHLLTGTVPVADTDEEMQDGERLTFDDKDVTDF